MTTKIRSSNINNTGVSSGSYTSANISVNNQGQVTAASSGSGGGIGINSSILLNKNFIDEDYTFPTDYNGLSVGPIQISTGVTITLPVNQRWVVI